MKKILVIGGNGFIGTNVVQYLVQKKYLVGVYDLSSGSEKGVEYYEGNINDDPNFERILSQYDTIIYLLSAIMPQMSMEDPLSSYQTDIPLLLIVLEACKKNNIKRVIYASSGGTVYGDSNIPNQEDKVTNPINHYAICKLTCEKILCLYNSLYNMENVILRIANPYGIGQRLESGVGAVTIFTKSIISYSKIRIYGDGENIRDYIDVRDVAKMFECAIRWAYEKQVPPIFNVGSGKGYSLLQLIEIISNELGIKAIVEFVPRREFDIKCSILDMSKTKSFFHFECEQDSESSIRQYVRLLKKRYSGSDFIL